MEAEDEYVECKKCNTMIFKANERMHSLQCGRTVGTTRRHPAPVKDIVPNIVPPSSHIPSIAQQEQGPAVQEHDEVRGSKETTQPVEELAAETSISGLSLTVKGDESEPNAQTRAEEYVGVPIRMLADNEYSNEKDMLAEDAKLAALLQLEEQLNSAAPRYASVAVGNSGYGERRPAEGQRGPTLVLSLPPSASASASAAAPNVGVSSSFAYSESTTPAEDIKRLQELRAQNAARANTTNVRQTSLPNPPREIPPNPRSGACSPHGNMRVIHSASASATETDEEMAQRIAREEEARFEENQANLALAQRLQREEEEAGRRGLHDLDFRRRVAQLKEQRAEEESKKWSRRFDPYMQEPNTRVLPSASAASPSSAARLAPVHDETDEEMAFRLALQERTAWNGGTTRPTGIKKAQDEDDVFNFERLRELKKQNAIAVQVARNAYRNAEEANRWENTHDRHNRGQQKPTLALQQRDHQSTSRQLGAAPPRPSNVQSPNSGQNLRVLQRRDSPSMLETDEEMARRIAQEEEKRFLQNEASLALALRLQREERDARGVPHARGGLGSNNRVERSYYRDMHAEREEAKAEGYYDYSLEDEIRARGRESDASREQRRHASTVAVVDSATRSRHSGVRGHRGAFMYAQPQSVGEDFERLDDDTEEVEKRFEGSTLNFSKNKRPNEGSYYRRRGL